MNTLKKLQAYMGGRKFLLPISLLMSALSNIVGLLPFVFMWLIVRDLLTNQGSANASQINQYAWWAVISAITGILMYFAALMFSHLAAFRVEVNLKRVAMKKVVEMPLGFFDKKSGGSIRKIIDDDAGTTHTFLAHQLPDVSASLITPIVILALLFVFDWRIGLACLVPVGVAFGVMGIMMSGKKGKRFMKLYMDAQQEMSGEAVEYVRGIPVVKVFQQTIYSFKRFYNSIIKYRDLVTSHTKMWLYTMSLYTIMVQGFAFFIVPVAILIVAADGNYALAITNVMFYVLITPVFTAAIMRSAYLQQNMYLAEQAITRIENLTAESGLKKADNPQKIKEQNISFENVEFAYPDAKKNAVDGVSFDIPKGKTFALVGASGSGKTTIARLIPRFWDTKSGAVKIGGIDVKNIDEKDLMQNISFVFQNTKLFKTTLRENILYGKLDATEDELNRAIDLSQSREIIDRLPEGLATKIGTEGTYLSGGEQQRIALARAILKDAPIVVLDEATAFADPENEELIQAALRQLMKGKTVLMIAHRLSTVKDVDCIMVIADGKIAEQGTHDELVANEGIYKQMWEEYQQAIKWTV